MAADCMPMYIRSKIFDLPPESDIGYKEDKEAPNLGKGNDLPVPPGLSMPGLSPFLHMHGDYLGGLGGLRDQFGGWQSGLVWPHFPNTSPLSDCMAPVSPPGLWPRTSAVGCVPQVPSAVCNSPPSPVTSPSLTGTSSVEDVAYDVVSNTLRKFGTNQGCWIEWQVKGTKLRSMDKQAVSPSFAIVLGGNLSTSFKILITPASRSDGRGGGSFRQAKGKGRVGLKCTDNFQNCSPGRAMLSIGIGDSPLDQGVQGPVVHDFAQKSCFEFGSQSASFNFAVALDSRDVFTVKLLFRGAAPGTPRDCQAESD